MRPGHYTAAIELADATSRRDDGVTRRRLAVPPELRYFRVHPELLRVRRGPQPSSFVELPEASFSPGYQNSRWQLSHA